MPVKKAVHGRPADLESRRHLRDGQVLLVTHGAVSLLVPGSPGWSPKSPACAGLRRVFNAWFNARMSDLTIRLQLGGVRIGGDLRPSAVMVNLDERKMDCRPAIGSEKWTHFQGIAGTLQPGLCRGPSDPLQILNAFIALDPVSPEAVAAFATTYGMLTACQRHQDYLDDQCLPCMLRTSGQERGDRWEPLEVWSLYVHAYRALLGMAADLGRDQGVRADEWHHLQGLDRELGKRPEKLEYQRSNLAFSLGRILQMASVWPNFGHLADRYQFLLMGSGLSAALALGAAATLAMGTAFRCGGCGRVAGLAEERKRPRSTGKEGRPQRNYCSPECQYRGRLLTNAEAYHRRREAKLKTAATIVDDGASRQRS